MKKLIIPALFLSVLASCGSKKEGFSLTGQVENLPDSSEVYLLTSDYVNQKLDTIAQGISIGGKFTLQGHLPGAEMCLLTWNNQQMPFQFIAENTPMMLTGNAQNISELKLTGSKSNEELESVEKMLAPYSDTLRVLNQQAMQLMQQGKVEELQQLGVRMQQIQNESTEKMLSYARMHPSSLISALFLAGGPVNDVNIIKDTYQLFTDDVKQSSAGKYIQMMLASAPVVTVGREAPNLTGQAPDGHTLSLNEIRGKVTLIDFWASWCGPCRQENPNVVKLYDKYKNQGLVILGVSLDKDELKWKGAIKKDGLNWYHISDMKGWDSPLAKTYNVMSIPATFLLDANGIIVAQDLRGEELEKAVSKLINQ